MSQLREARGALKANMEIPSQLSAYLEMLVEPNAMLGVRLGTGNNLHGLDVLIQWKGLSPLEATWEPYSLIQQQFPTFHLRCSGPIKGV